MSNEITGTFNGAFGRTERLAKYFSSWYDAVLMLEIIGRIGSSSTAISFFNLCILAVP